MGQEIVELLVFLGVDANQAHAHGQAQVPELFHAERPDALLDPSQKGPFAQALGAHGQDGELVPADPAEDIGFPKRAPEDGGDALQEQVPDRVAVRVVDLFEVVDIEEDQVIVLLEALGELPLRRFPIGDVDEDAVEVVDRPVGPLDAAAIVANPESPAVDSLELELLERRGLRRQLLDDPERSSPLT